VPCDQLADRRNELTGDSHDARLIPRWRRQGYRVKLLCLKLASVNLALSRVAARVLQGGHGVADDVVVLRFAAGWRNFERAYKPLVDGWALYDNSGDAPILVKAGGRP
jgi:predicted ABC-type ATPase